VTLEFLIAVLLGGLVVGALARLAVPGPDPMPIWATILLGVGGSVLGGFIGQMFLGTIGSFFPAFLGALVLLLGYRRFVQKRPITGPDAKLPPR
jgi:uncharacterized membrane protein YeaQ/YmgE (transglycosylase-associated protein family)